MRLGYYFSKGLDIARLREEAISEVADDAGCRNAGLLFISIAAASTLAGVMFTVAAFAYIFKSMSTSSGPLVIAVMLVQIILPFFMIVHLIFHAAGAVHAAERLFGGHGRYLQSWRVEAISSVVFWPSIVPFIGAVISLWSLAVNARMLCLARGMTRTRAREAAVAAAAASMIAALCIGYFVIWLLFLRMTAGWLPD